MGKLIYTVVEVKKFMFAKINLIKSDIFFAKNDQYTILHLKKNKNNTKY